jgi:site-specific DNA recombinase
MTSAARLELVTPKPELIAALYRRYSSDVQNDRSIERQTADLEKAAPRLGLKLDERFYYEDRAQSATTLFDRPGLTRHLLGAVEKKLFDVVLVEHTDRLARKGADLFWLAEQFKFLRGPQGNPIKIFTPAGEVSDLQLTFESYHNAADSAKTSFRVRSGHNDAAREMLICNAAPYGDDDVLGKPGVKAPNKSEVEIVNRICRETAARMSPRNIAFGLTRDGVPSPNGGAWTFQTINKILQNQLYVGVYVRDKVRKIRNPNTGKRVPRPVAPEDWVTVEMPHLRIVDQDLWDAAQAVRQERASKTFGNKQVERATVARRLHPFAGLFRCAECGGKMIICGSARKGDRAIACSAAWWRSTCSHGKSYSLARLTKLATDKMHEHLTNPEFVKERAMERAKELARMEREASAERDKTQRDLDRVELKIKKLIRLTLDDESEDIPQEAQDELKALRVEKRGLEQRLNMLDAKSDGTIPHPSAVKALARDVDTLHEMLRDNPDDPACRLALGNLVERVMVHPTGFNQPYEVTVLARHAAYVGDLPLFPEYQRKNMAGNQPVARINPDNAAVPS